MISVGLDMIIMIDLSARDDAKNTIRSYKIPKRYVIFVQASQIIQSVQVPWYCQWFYFFLLYMTPVDFFHLAHYAESAEIFAQTSLADLVASTSSTG